MCDVPNTRPMFTKEEIEYEFENRIAVISIYGTKEIEYKKVLVIQLPRTIKLKIKLLLAITYTLCKIFLIYLLLQLAFSTRKNAILGYRDSSIN